ncbi:MAG: GspE/PulE family protein [Halanaerobiales bacterium]
MSKNNKKKLGELLVDFNYITEEQLKEVIEEQGKDDRRLGQILVEKNYIKEDDLNQVLEFQLGIPYVDLSKFNINPGLSEYIPEQLAQRYQAVPLALEDNKLSVAMSDPSDLVAVDDLERASGYKIEPLIATQKEIKKALGIIYSTSEDDTAEVFASLNNYQSGEEPELDELKQMVEDAPIVRLTNLIINQAVQMRASDIHIEPQKDKVQVRYRVDGVLRKGMDAPKYSQAALISRLKIIANLDITRRRIPQDGRVKLNIKGMEVDLRVSTLPTIFGEKVVIRILNRDEGLLNIGKLGFEGYNYEALKKLTKKPYGILLATGPTGSGKSTTLFAILNQLNDMKKNIITIEDPVEYQIDGINQVQANSKTNLTFARTLRSILRQDPDIIMVGEIRDEETAQIAVRAALTGHLVLSTLHTNDAVSSITRLIDMGIPPYLVSSTVIGVIAQRLLRRLCNSCKEETSPDPEIKEFLELQDGEKIFKAKQNGCEKCSHTGYRGRIAVQEVLVVDENMKELITDSASESKIKKYALDQGMITLTEDSKNKVKEGITSYQEAARIIV